jgi:hypothetical protein
LEYVFIGLLALSVVLFILSALMKDPVKNLRDEIDQLSIQHIQDMYTVKKKLKVLEEELLVSDDYLPPAVTDRTLPRPAGKKDIHEIIKNQVWSLAQQGLTIEQIARQSSLNIEDVEMIISEKIEKQVKR